jgi:Lrp/AsnC family transcriptional regulator, regulator for asnA, asnC and gidA
MTHQPDDMDNRIIARLRKENASNTELARQLDVSEGMIRQRIKRLKEAGILKVTARINPDILPNQQVALIAANIQQVAQLEDKAREVRQLNKVLSVSIVSGRYDLMIEVLVDSNHGLVDFLTADLASVDSITTTESFLLLKSYGKYV